MSILLGDGSGGFAAGVEYPAGPEPTFVATGDLNGDGVLDLAVTNGSLNAVSVLLGNGNGIFGAAVAYPAGTNPLSVSIADVDLDGDPDLVVASTVSDNISILRGNGDGTFAAAVQYGAGDGPVSVAADDLDNDGDLDIVSANANSHNVSVLLNACVPAPDLAITKTHSGNFTQGQTGATYTLVVTNSGTAATSGLVTVTDTLPAGLTPTAPNGTVNGWTCGIAGQTVTCTRSDALPSGGSYPSITITVNVAADASAMVTNTADVSGGGDADTTNNTASDPATITQVPDLTIAKSHAGSFAQGQTGATYSIAVTNSGFAPTSGVVTVSDTLPAGLTPTAPNGVVSGWTCTIVAQTVTCTRSDALGAGGSYPVIPLTVNVATDAPANVTNTAQVSGGGETNTANNSATDSTAITQLPDLTITKSHAGNFAQGQSGATYTIVVTNSGFAPTTGLVTVTDTLPSGLTPTAPNGPADGWSCGIAGQTVTCTRSDALPAGGTYPAITLSVNVANDAPAAVTNSAQVSAASESNTANNSASDPTTIVSTTVNVSIQKSAGGTPVAGQPLIYTITVANTGAVLAATVDVVDVLPASVIFVEATTSQGTCSGTSTVNCTLGSLPGGENATITLEVIPTSPGPLSNTATVSTAGQANSGSSAGTSAVVVAAVTPIPTVGGWAMILMAVAIAVAGLSAVKP